MAGASRLQGVWKTRAFCWPTKGKVWCFCWWWFGWWWSTPQKNSVLKAAGPEASGCSWGWTVRWGALCNVPIFSRSNLLLLKFFVPFSDPMTNLPTRSPYIASRFLIKFHPASSSNTSSGDDSDVDSEESNYEVKPEEGKAEVAESNARALRKKAGLPELELDALPSTIVPKILWLVKILNKKPKTISNCHWSCLIPDLFLYLGSSST